MLFLCVEGACANWFMPFELLHGVASRHVFNRFHVFPHSLTNRNVYIIFPHLSGEGCWILCQLASLSPSWFEVSGWGSLEVKYTVILLVRCDVAIDYSLGMALALPTHRKIAAGTPSGRRDL